MNSYIFHISLYDLAFLAVIFIGLTFAALLWFIQTNDRTANRFLALALIILAVGMMRTVAIDMGLNRDLPRWDRLPMQFLLALGPCIYFYVLKLTRQSRSRWRSLLHFSPLLAELMLFAFEIRESERTGVPTYATQTFRQLNPVLELLIFISIIFYLYRSYKLIQHFYSGLQPVLMDRPLFEFRLLRRSLAAAIVLLLSWFVYAVVRFAGYDDRSGGHFYQPFSIVFGVFLIRMAVAAFVRQQAATMVQTTLPARQPVRAELRAKGNWLKKEMEANLYYLDPELRLGTLAGKLGLSTHELSRIINIGLKKSFNDLVNEYRVREVARKMQDPAYDHLTLLGIAYESGFNSQSTFTRILKQITGKSPTEYKNELKKEYPTYKLGNRSQFATVISDHHSTSGWRVGKVNRNYLFKMNFMLKNYWMVAWRSLVRNRIYSLVNVLGLSLGICACLAIYLITRYEFSFDDFHPDRDRLFCVDAVSYGGRWNCVPGPMPAAMRREMTGLQTVAAYQTYQAGVTIPDGPDGKPKSFDDAGSIAIAEPQYFEIFQYRWLSGNPGTSLNAPNSVVLTAEKARQYFGDLSPDRIIGRNIYYRDSLAVTVTGIVADWTGNSDFNFTQWISYATIPVSFLKNEITLDSWDKLDRSSHVVIKLAQDVKPSQVDAQLIAFAKNHFGPKPSFTGRLQPLSGSHFHQEYGGTGRKASLPVLYTLMAVAGFILILAIVNFVNLSTAQSMQRAREIGVRKVLGGSRSGIAVQFFTETLLLTVAAAGLAVLMVNPAFNVLRDLIPGSVHFRFNGATFLFLLLVIVITTLFAGFYPAKVLGSYQPSVTLKGITAVLASGKGMLRRGLIIFQFTISLLFIIASVVIGAQLRYVLHAELGFRTDAIITLGGPRDNGMANSSFGSDKNRPRQRTSGETGKTAILMDRIRQLPGVEQVISEAKPPMDQRHSGFGGGSLKGNDERPIDISLHYGGADYLPFYGMKLVAGRNMLPGDNSKELLISEACARALGFADVSRIIGQEVVVGPGEAYPVAGVIEDFYESSFRLATWPVIIRHDPGKENTIAVRIAAKGMTAAQLKTLIGDMEKDWKTIFPEKPFGYSFLDESIASMYADDLRTERLTNVAMGITVFISCLGLLGLAIFSTEKRAREIGIRKVMGATVPGIVAMLCREIILLIVIALVIASPLAWYFMHGWLQGFAYRTALHGWMFFAAGAAAIGIALLTVGFQAMKAAMANPVRSLRTE